MKGIKKNTESRVRQGSCRIFDEIKSNRKQLFDAKIRKRRRVKFFCVNQEDVNKTYGQIDKNLKK